MKNRFYCKTCDKIFETEGIKKEYTDPVFGPCASYLASCPDCNSECKEYFKPKHFKTVSAETIPPCGNPNMGCACCT